MNKKALNIYTLVAIVLFIGGIAGALSLLILWLTIIVLGFITGVIMLFIREQRSTGLGLVSISLAFLIIGTAICSQTVRF